MDQIAAGRPRGTRWCVSAANAPFDNVRSPGAARGAGQADLAAWTRTIPRPVQGLRGGGTTARGRLAEPLRIIGTEGSGKRCTGARLDRDNPECRTLPGSGPLRGEATALAAGGALLESAARCQGSNGEGLSRPPLELCLNDQCPSMVEIRRSERTKRARAAKEVADNGAAPTRPPRRRLRRNGGQRAQAPREPSPERLEPSEPVPAHAASSVFACSSPWRGSTARGRHAGRAARRGPGPETLLLREPEDGCGDGSVPAEGSAGELRSADRAACSRGTAELCARLVRPALERGHDVVCDRFVDSDRRLPGRRTRLSTDLVGALETRSPSAASPARPSRCS